MKASKNWYSQMPRILSGPATMGPAQHCKSNCSTIRKSFARLRANVFQNSFASHAAEFLKLCVRARSALVRKVGPRHWYLLWTRFFDQRILAGIPFVAAFLDRRSILKPGTCCKSSRKRVQLLAAVTLVQRASHPRPPFLPTGGVLGVVPPTPLVESSTRRKRRRRVPLRGSVRRSTSPPGRRLRDRPGRG